MVMLVLDSWAQLKWSSSNVPWATGVGDYLISCWQLKPVDMQIYFWYLYWGRWSVYICWIAWII